MLGVLSHIILDPVEHQTNQYVGIDTGNKLLVFLPDIHFTDFFIDHVQQKPVYKGLQIFFDLFPVDTAVDIQNKGLVVLYRLKDL